LTGVHVEENVVLKEDQADIVVDFYAWNANVTKNILAPHLLLKLLP
jgi:hypothetical protein